MIFKVKFNYLLIVSKETILSFGSNRSQAIENSSERIDYFLDNISSNTLNERIADNLDTIEREIAVRIERNDLRDTENEYFVESESTPQFDDQYPDSVYQSINNSIDYYVSTNAFNAQNISEKQFEEIFKDSESDKSRDIGVDVNGDKVNKRLIEWSGSEQRPVASEADLEAKPLNLVANHSMNYSEKETTNKFWSDKDFNHMVYKNEFPYRDRNLKNLFKNVYNNNSIIAVETNDRDIDNANALTTNTTNTSNANITENTSNSLIDRINYLTAKEENKSIAVLEDDQNWNKLNRLREVGKIVPASDTEGAQKYTDDVRKCHQSVADIKHHVSGESLAVSVKPWPDIYVNKLCLYVSARDECNTSSSVSVRASDNRVIIGFPSDKCSNSVDGKCGIACVNCSDCLLSLKSNNSGDNSTQLNYLIGWYDCKDNTSQSNCKSFSIDFDSNKQDSVRVVVIISATVVPIVCVALIAIVCVWNKNKTAMKKFDW